MKDEEGGRGRRASEGVAEPGRFDAPIASSFCYLKLAALNLALACWAIHCEEALYFVRRSQGAREFSLPFGNLNHFYIAVLSRIQVNLDLARFGSLG